MLCFVLGVLCAQIAPKMFGVILQGFEYPRAGKYLAAMCWPPLWIVAQPFGATPPSCAHLQSLYEIDFPHGGFDMGTQKVFHPFFLNACSFAKTFSISPLHAEFQGEADPPRGRGIPA